MKELLSATINKSSITKSLRGIAAHITLLSSGGLAISGADVNI
jgi:hypothetical protein